MRSARQPFSEHGVHAITTSRERAATAGGASRALRKLVDE